MRHNDIRLIAALGLMAAGAAGPRGRTIKLADEYDPLERPDIKRTQLPSPSKFQTSKKVHTRSREIARRLRQEARRCAK